MTTIGRNGVTVLVPNGWDAELVDHPGKRVVLHMSNGPLPDGRSDFGGHALQRLGDGKSFLSILEYDSREADTGLFGSIGLPAFVPSEFDPNKLHRYLRGQTAAQRFFSMGHRTFSCYVVVARDSPTTSDLSSINQAVQGLDVSSIQ